MRLEQSIQEELILQTMELSLNWPLVEGLVHVSEMSWPRKMLIRKNCVYESRGCHSFRD